MSFKRYIQSVSITIAGLLLGGCDLPLLHPEGFIADKEFNILIISVALMLIVVVPVVFMSIFFSVRYHEKNENAVYEPEWAHSTLLEIIWWSVPCIIIAVLATITWVSSHELDPFQPLYAKNNVKPITIQAVAMRWKWLFIYPDQNIATVNYVQFPAGVPINFEITAEGPMNSLLIPQLAGQIYAMAGMHSQLHLIADKTGDYQGFSANFSGDGFSDMKFVAHVGTQSEFDQWVAKSRLSHNVLNRQEYDRLAAIGESMPVTVYSAANKYLFNIALMRAMMPIKAVDALCKQRSWA